MVKCTTTCTNDRCLAYQTQQDEQNFSLKKKNKLLIVLTGVNSACSCLKDNIIYFIYWSQIQGENIDSNWSLQP